MYNLPAPFTLLLGDLPTLVRMELTKLLHAEPDLRVIGSAAGPDELVAQARRLRPDLVIAAENQLLGLEQLARQQPVPVLLYSHGTPLVGMLREAARWGVFDYIRPLLGREHPGFGGYRLDLLRKIRSVRTVPAAPAAPALLRSAVPMPPNRVVVLGGSTGGTAAVEALVRHLRPAANTTVVVAVHLPAHFTDSLVERLRRAAQMPVVAGPDGTDLNAGTIVVVPGGQNMVIRAVQKGAWLAWQMAATQEASPTPDEPSIDLLMRSAARAFGRHATGVVLTGLGTDGTLGAQSIRQAGGVVVAQDEASSAVFSMPGSVIRAGAATTVLSLAEIPGYLTTLAVPGRPVWLGSVHSSPQAVSR